MTNTLSKFNITPSRFAKEIEELVIKQKTDHIHAILTYCEVNGLDIESVPNFLSPSLKEKIAVAAEDLHLSPKTSKLPL